MPKSRVSFFLLLAAGAFLALWFVHLATFLAIPPNKDQIQKIIDIPPGSNLRRVTDLLEREGFIRNPTYFIIAGKVTGVERAIKPGEYALHGRMRPLQVLNHLKKGIVHQYEVVIPEGYAVRQIAQVLEEKGLAEAEQFMALAADSELAESLGIPSDNLEGYLFPSTYFISRATTAEEIIRQMVRAFHTAYTSDLREREREMGLNTHEVVTMASIIEKETSSEAERDLISGVFHNRLKRNMRLQSDPTVIYGIADFDGNLKRVHLQTDTPYNTYRRRGLPPGPIANPGRASLIAALYPASVDYLYFVSRNDGTHYFSRNIDEHNRAVARFQKSGRRK